MKNYGLLGRKLLHSLSPEIHRELGNFRYELFEVEPENLDSFFADKSFAGINVTFPYKNDVIKYCDEITDAAKKTGSVDIITVDDDGRLIGDNVEYLGFMYMIKKGGIEVSGRKVLILGSGANSLTVNTVMQVLGASEIITASRNGEINFHNLYEHSDANIIVNTTNTGIYPNNGEKIIDITQFPELCGVLELIYNPRRTRLICDAEDLEIPNIDGLAMLVEQGYQTEIRFGRISPDEELARATYKTMSDRRKNIIFVGMPGCGKTTIAKVIAAKLGRPCIDVGRLVEIRAGMSKADIFMIYGEVYYRELESEILKKITRNGGQVIATDSGAVESLKNQYYIRQNGYVVWLYRPFDELVSNGVHLARNREALTRIGDVRNPIYKFLADIRIDVTDNAEKTVSQIINTMQIKENPSTEY